MDTKREGHPEFVLIIIFCLGGSISNNNIQLATGCMYAPLLACESTSGKKNKRQ